MSLELKIERILTLLTRKESGKRKVKDWVGATWIQELTGWSGERLRQAREQGIIEARKIRTKVYEYRLSSLPEQFIKSKRTEEVSTEQPAIKLQTAL